MSPAKRKIVPRNRAEAEALGVDAPARRRKGDGGLFFSSRGLWEGRIELPPDPVTGKRRTKVVRSKNRDGAQEKLDAWLRNEYLPGFMKGSPAAICATWSPIPQGAAPMAIPKVENTDRLDVQLWFLDEPAKGGWQRFRDYAKALEATGLAKVVFASPWLPTVVGTVVAKKVPKI